MPFVTTCVRKLQKRHQVRKPVFVIPAREARCLVNQTGLLHAFDLRSLLIFRLRFHPDLYLHLRRANPFALCLACFRWHSTRGANSASVIGVHP